MPLQTRIDLHPRFRRRLACVHQLQVGIPAQREFAATASNAIAQSPRCRASSRQGEGQAIPIRYSDRTASYAVWP
jgi:hypothetical protein